MQLPFEIENTVSVLNARYSKNNYLIYKLLLAVVVVVGISLPIIEVDITSQSRGIVRPLSNNIHVTPIVSGRVKKANVINNQAVIKGDTLLVVEMSNINEQLQANVSVLNDIRERLADLDVLTDDNKNKCRLITSLYRGEWMEYQSRLEDLNVKSRQYERELNRAAEGLKMGLVSDFDYNRIKDEFIANELNIKSFKTQQNADWQKIKKQLEEQKINMEGDVNRIKSELTNYVVEAPISGTLVTDIQIQNNSYINAGQTVATITPEDNLIVECYVEPMDVGFIEKNQEVTLQYDAFNYNQWGVGHAIVYDIDKNVTIQEDRTFFIVRCRMKDTSLSLKNGYTVNIRKGMTLNGRFLVTKRTLWQLLFDKIDDWFNPKLSKVS
ncbi:MAG: HlyD family efflux transporter periplasmic adaptor subunit [Paludibacteraceae bacterium]|nr:HlyD family efflux transporter periplasmic adaptor subunit [Paludibacteraceae bacterium]